MSDWIKDDLIPTMVFVFNPRHKELYITLIVLFALWRMGVI